jgi:hypothetical protein
MALSYNLTMREIAGGLAEMVERAAQELRRTGDKDASAPVLPGGWSRKQAMGHLIWNA